MQNKELSYKNDSSKPSLGSAAPLMAPSGPRVPCLETNLEAALYWLRFGLRVIPLRPASKITALPWDPWLESLTEDSIKVHWERHPDHEIGFIVGDDLLVIDADDPMAVTACHLLMSSFDKTCNHIVDTTKGQHFYFRRVPGILARSDSHDTAQHPERLDIKTGRAMVVLPPSTGKTVSMSEADTVNDLVEVGQDFIDAIYRHNGRVAPSQQPEPRPLQLRDPQDKDQLVTDMRYLLQHIDPDCGYDDWCSVGMAIHHETRGTDIGLQLYDDWSSQGEKYPGYQALVTKWRSFSSTPGNPITLGTLCMLAANDGADLEKVGEEFFTALDEDLVIVEPPEPEKEVEEHGLAKYSLRGMSGQFEKDMQEQVSILGDIALLGQWTVIYGRPNAGKSLLTLHMLIEAIKSGKIDPETLYYINADDDYPGMTRKLKMVVEQHNFHMLAPGHVGFRAKDFLDLIEDLCRRRQAQRTIVVLDTLKKFVDPMDKRSCSEFGEAIRPFIAQGGTLIGLAHTNKNPGQDGKPVFAGTSDIVDDADCAYVMDILDEKDGIRTVEFENIKMRGDVSRRAVYQYDCGEKKSYLDRLYSVVPIDEAQADSLREAIDQRGSPEHALIAAITVCITDGVTSKTKIVEKVASDTGKSQRQAQTVLEQYTGSDPEAYLWDFTIGPRGVKTYELHLSPDDGADDDVEIDDEEEVY